MINFDTTCSYIWQVMSDLVILEVKVSESIA